jgi:UDP-2,4-diacetamido-2,4,6-trideoxy-beta-L-altropyranose hydrolase
MTTLAIRVDAVPETGLGHLTRCLALAHAARAEGCRVHGIGRITEATTRVRAELGVDVWHELPASHPDGADLPACLTALDTIAPDWIVLDGYAFDTGYQRALRACAKLLVLDDSPRLKCYSADLLLDQNLGAEDRDYPLENGRALRGGAYLLLRPAFLATERKRASPAEDHEPPARLLLTLGGQVERLALEAVLAGLAQVATPLDITLLTGADPDVMNWVLPHLAPSHHWHPLPWHDDMPGLMRHSDLAIAAAGSTAWELAYMGVPSLLLVLADNQAGVAAALDAAGAAVNLGQCDPGFAPRLAGELQGLLADAPRRERLTEHARALIDGRGAQRVLEAMRCTR